MLREELSTDPSPELAAELHRRVAEGFPDRRRARALTGGRSRSTDRRDAAPSARPLRRSRLAEGARRLAGKPVMVGALSLLLVGVLLTPVLLERADVGSTTLEVPTTVAPGEGDESEGPGSGPSELPSPLVEQPGVGSGSAPWPGDDGIAAGRRERRVERSGSLTLAAPDERMEQVADAIVRTVDRHRGIVISSSVSSGEETAGGGTFALRVPVGDLSPVMRELSALGEVRGRSQSGEDVTASFAAAQERLAEERAERRSLLRRLERAGSATEVAAIRARIRILAGRVRRIASELRSLRTRTEYAAVSVSLVSEDAEVGPVSGTDIAFDDFVDSLVGSLNLALRLLGVVLPLAVVAVPGALAVRALRRRRREAVLG